MDNSIKAYDLGTFQTVEDCQKVSINELVRIATKDLRERIVEAQIEALGYNLQLTTSKTRFNGERLWFLCPSCKKRAGILYTHPATDILGCRKCLKLLYRQQSYN